MERWGGAEFRFQGTRGKIISSLLFPLTLNIGTRNIGFVAYFMRVDCGVELSESGVGLFRFFSFDGVLARF